MTSFREFLENNNTLITKLINKLMKKHPGFKKVQSKIEKEGYSKKAAGAILANATREASPKAKKANPKLKKVK